MTDYIDRLEINNNLSHVFAYKCLLSIHWAVYKADLKFCWVHMSFC